MTTALNSNVLSTFNLALTGKLNLNASLSETNLAKVGDPRPTQAEILTNAFVFVKNDFPTISDLSGPLSALRVAAAGKFLTESSQNTRIPAIDDFNKTDRFLKLQTDALGDLRSQLELLQGSVQELREKGTLNLFSGFSSQSDVVEISAGSTASVGGLSVQVTQQALNNVLVSDVQPTTALGLTGTFSVNGVDVEVEATDNLLDIQNKINRGEDRDGNGVLDGPEDVNGNGLIDIIEVPGSQFFEGLVIIEDRNQNGVLDPTEDTNDNGRLDGGTAVTGVTAAISADGRLVLSTEEGRPLNLDDPDDLLLTLGLFAPDINGDSVKKEEQLVTLNGVQVNLNQAGQGAKIEVDGKTFTSDTNTFANVDEGVTLTVKGTSDDTIQVRVFLDAAAAVDQIDQLFERFNSTITRLNSILGDNSIFDRDFDIQSLRQELVADSQNRIRSQGELDDAVRQVTPSQQDRRSLGLESQNTDKTTFQEVGISNAVANLRNNLADLFQNVGNRLFQQLSSIGIRTEEDDTVDVDRAQLRRTLTSNPANVFDVLENPDSGILPQLEQVLEQALSENLGTLDFKEAQLRELAQIPSRLAELFQDNANNANNQLNLKNLIAVA